MTVIRYGTSGNPPNFFSSKYGKDKKNAVEWINSIGLNAYEYMMTYGARATEETVKYVGEKAKKLDIALSVHGPYYVVLSSEKERVLVNSVRELKKTCHLSHLMGARKVVLHPGFGNDVDKVIKGLKEVEKDKPKDVIICPETMGKISQLGSLDQVLTICEQTECEPCVDFGHVHARTLGTLKSTKDYRKIVMEIEKRFGKKVLKRLHCHFYPVEFTDKGEKKHRAVMEKGWLPKFQHFAPVIKEFNMVPTLISESRDSQDIGALEMKKIMEKL